eukprot:CAMPEP_0116136710 /NCGR_PEP_ID=MMETSP0329-20121206/11872_1 /TAXON_ID=697910 /ORGANISM="Pseudo-nitzschia arenysensis, Strain B593" /LENGTH=146 /DNA_ID=CAMNT_0003631601 /DNA_START=220 /DNA_END=660 /DNA_ORIENTATION=+
MEEPLIALSPTSSKKTQETKEQSPNDTSIRTRTVLLEVANGGADNDCDDSNGDDDLKQVLLERHDYFTRLYLFVIFLINIAILHRVASAVAFEKKENNKMHLIFVATYLSLQDTATVVFLGKSWRCGRFCIALATGTSGLIAVALL